MQGVKDLMSSERGWFALAVLLAATVLAALKIISGTEWKSIAMWISMSLIASKTVSGALDSRNGVDTTGGTTP